MKTKFLAAAGAATALAMGLFAADIQVSSAAHHEAGEEAMAVDYAAVLASDTRPDSDKERDGGRMPADVLAKVGLKAGDVVIDIGAGSGYYSHIFALTVGESGAVYAINRPSTLERFTQITPTMEKRIEAVAPARIEHIPAEFHEINVEGADLAFMGQMYHEVIRTQMDADAINGAVFNALKPGGYYVIEIHNAVEGSGPEVSDTYHRADPAIVRGDVLAAGFELVEENTEILGNPDDPKEIGIFDPSIRGNTDRTVFFFRKPE